MAITNSKTNEVPSLARSLVAGGLGFGVVSLCVFATVAFAERWMYRESGHMRGNFVGICRRNG